MTYSAHPGAERDIEHASDFYRDRAGLAVARRFLAEVDRVAKLVDRNPDAGALLAEGRRMFHLKAVPYSWVYRKLDAGIQVLIVRHHHQNPRHGMRRV